MLVILESLREIFLFYLRFGSFQMQTYPEKQVEMSSVQLYGLWRSLVTDECERGILDWI